jgi:tetratricopeptide (TPR) repeat protein
MKKIIFFFLVLGLDQHNELNAQAKQGQARIDSLLGLLKKAETSHAKNGEDNLADTVKVKLLINIAHGYYAISPTQGGEYASQALALAEKLKWKMGIANANNTQGVIFWAMAEYQKAQEYYSKALKQYEELGSKSQIADCLDNIGDIFLYQADYPGALEYFLRSLKINEDLDDKKAIATNFGNIGIVYDSQEEFAKALEYYFKALKMSGECGDKNGISRNLGSIGNVYNHRKEYPKALEYYLNSLKTCEETGDIRGVATNQGNIGSLYYVQKNYPEALKHHLSAVKLNRELVNKNGLAAGLSNVGATYYSIATDSNEVQLNKLFSGNKREALLQAKNYIDSATIMFKEMGDLNGLFNMYNDLSEIYSQLEDYKAALEYHKLFASTQDSVFNAENNKKLAGLEAKREAELKERELELAKAEEERKQNIQLAGIGVFIMLLIGGLLLVSKRRIKPGIISVLSTFSVLLIFELVALLLHPYIINLTHHNLILTLICLVAVASIIIPLHHKAEHWMKKRLVRKEVHSEPVDPSSDVITESEH